MGYALFAQRKVQLTGNLNLVTLQQTQRSNEQYLLATQTLSLQQQMTSIQSAQSLELAELYELLANSTEEGLDEDFDPDQDEFSDFANELIDDDANREQINAAIQQKEAEFEAELDQMNRQIYLVSVKENAIEMEVKRLDTQVSSLQKQLEAVEEAEGSAIDRATPKFKGVG